MGNRYAGSRGQQQRPRRSLAGGEATAFRASQQLMPITFIEGCGAYLGDIDCNGQVDCALVFRPMLPGHSPVPVRQSVQPVDAGRQLVLLMRDADTEAARFLDRWGEGIFGLALLVGDVDTRAGELAARGVERFPDAVRQPPVARVLARPVDLSLVRG